MTSLEALCTTSREIIGDRTLKHAKHLASSKKKTIADVSNTKKLFTVATCTEATKCYNIVAYPHASVCAQHFGIDLSYLLVLF